MVGHTTHSAHNVAVHHIGAAVGMAVGKTAMYRVEVEAQDIDSAPGNVDRIEEDTAGMTAEADIVGMEEDTVGMEGDTVAIGENTVASEEDTVRTGWNVGRIEPGNLFRDEIWHFRAIRPPRHLQEHLQPRLPGSRNRPNLIDQDDLQKDGHVPGLGNEWTQTVQTDPGNLVDLREDPGGYGDRQRRQELEIAHVHHPLDTGYDHALVARCLALRRLAQDRDYHVDDLVDGLACLNVRVLQTFASTKFLYRRLLLYTSSKADH